MKATASTPLVPTTLRWSRVVALVALMTQLILPSLAYPAGVLAEEAPATEIVAAQPVADTTPPTVTVPETTYVVADPVTGGAVVDFDVWAEDDVDGPVDVACDWPPGSSFPVGTTTVTCAASDAAGNTGNGAFDVTVDPAPDTTAPVIGDIPADIQVAAEDGSGATATYAQPTALDDVDGAVFVECAPASGSWFAIGTTTVACSASDAAGNRAEASFAVTVDAVPTAVPTDTPAPAPTEVPTEEPTATPTEEPTATPTEEPATPPSIESDKDDYAPGEAVTLTGANWQPGETVHINVNDDEGQTWRRDVDVVADEDGMIADAFNLPDWFVATYTVKATGAQSGTVTATFTDSISFSDTATNSNGGSTSSLTLSKPGTVVAGDVLLAQITYSGTTGLSTLSPPSGWSLINRRDNGAAIGQSIYWKVAGATEPASYTWIFSPNRRAAGAITVYSGAASPNPVDAFASAVGSGTSLTAPNIATGTRSTMVVTFYGIGANAALSPPPSMTQRYHLAAASTGPTVMGSDVVQFDTGATGANTSTSNQSAPWVAHTIAINWVQTDTGGSGGGAVTSLTQDRPVDATEGDLLLANIMLRGGTASITAPSGWTLVAMRTNTNSQLVTQATYWKFVGASDPASYTWVFSVPRVAVGGVVAYAGIDPQNPVDAFATNPATDSVLGSSSSLTAPSVTTTSANAVIVALYAASANGSIAAPSGMLVRYNVGSASSRLAAFDVSQTTVGPSGNKIASDPGSVQYVAQTIALRRMSTGPTKLAFTTASHAGAVNGCLGPITVQTQNAGDVPTDVASNTTVSLASDGTGAFFGDGSCANPAIVSVALATGSNSASFYYSPTARGTGSHTLTASAAGLAGATQAQLVARAGQTIDFAVLADKTYGDAPFTASATGGGSGNPVSFSVGATDACTSTGTNGATITITGAGSCTVTASQGGNADYDAATSVSRAFLIAQAVLDVDAADQGKTYGDPNPSPTFTLSGFRNGEDAATAGVTGAASCSYAAHAENAGTYADVITCAPGSLSSANYSFATGDRGDLTIEKAVLTVTADDQSKAYGDANPTLTAGYSGFVNGENLGTSGVTGAPSLTTTATEFSGVGTVPIAAALGSLASGNYGFAFVDGTLTITRAELEVDADDGTKTYGDTDPAFTYTLSGFRNGEDATAAGVTGAASCSLDPAAGPNVGTYAEAITCAPGTLSAANYDFTTGNRATLAITTRPITVTAAAKSKTYGNPDPALTYSVTAGTLVGTDAIGGSLTRAAGENVGAYAIQQGTLSAGANYALAYVGADLTIAARPVTVRADDTAKVLGATDPVLTYAVTGGSVVTGDAFSGGLTRDPGEGVGSYAIRQGTLSLGSNYVLTFVDGTFTIVYAFGGFLQPINYTAHATGVQPNTSIFKAGSTVPVKFELRDAAGNLLPCDGTATWLGSVKGGPVNAPVNESTFTDPATGGGTYTCANGRYHFNWSTKGLAAGYYYRIGVTLADGETYYVYIGLK